MIVVTTPTGKIGSKVVEELLSAEKAVRIIARDPAKLPSELLNKVEVVKGSSDDENILLKAFEGADSLFWVVPPSFSANNDEEYYLKFTQPACRAIKECGVKRVVAVSGLGRGVPVKAGPVTASFAKDAEIEKTGVDFRALWCPGFMENMLGSLNTIKQNGVFYVPSPPDLKMPFVATRDIAAAGAKLLLDESWTGQGGVAVLGPEDLSYDDMASIMTDVLGKPVRFQRITGEALRVELIKSGANPVFAQGIVDMRAAKANGLDNTEPRTAKNTTPTSFRQWCNEVLKPGFLS